MDEVMLELVQHLEQARREAARRAQPRARRDVRHAGDLDTRAEDAGQTQRLADDRVLDLVDMRRALDLGVAQQHLLERRAVHGDVHVLRDGGGDEKATVPLVVGRKVGASAAERDAQWAASDDHADGSLEFATACAPAPRWRASTRKPSVSSGSKSSRSSTRAPTEMPPITGATSGSVQ